MFKLPVLRPIHVHDNDCAYYPGYLRWLKWLIPSFLSSLSEFLCMQLHPHSIKTEKKTWTSNKQFLVIVVVTKGGLNKTISFHLHSYTIRQSNLPACCLVYWPIQESDPIFLALFISAKFVKFDFVKIWEKCFWCLSLTRPKISVMIWRSN